MEWFFLAVLLVFFGSVIFFGGAAAFATSSMRRANRLLPGQPGGTAPLRWLWSPGSGALLHRRLRNACQLVAATGLPARPARKLLRRAKPAPVDGVTALAQEVLREALVLDDQVVAASRLAPGAARSQAMALLNSEVERVEDAARRVHRLALKRAQFSRLPSQAALSLQQRISVMEEAFGELSRPTQV